MTSRTDTVKRFLASTLLHQFLALTAVIALITFIGYLAVTTLSLFLVVIYTMAFLLGLAFIPLFAYTIGPITGPIAEGVANLLWMVSNLGVRRPVLVQRETDEYDIIRGNKDWGPVSYWTRWAMAPFGITFDATREAFEDALVTSELKQELEHLVFDKNGISRDIEMDRGGYDWYVDENDKETIENDGVLVFVGQKLSELRNAAGPSLGLRAYTAGLEKHGGDTSGASIRLRLIGSIVFTVLGLGMGFVVFF